MVAPRPATVPINNPEPPEPTRLTPLDQAVGLYHSFGEDFIALLDSYVSSFPESKRYTFIGPGYILLSHEETRTNPHISDSPITDPYWYVTYASSAHGIYPLIKFMPYHLDRVGFARYAKYPERGVRFLETRKLQRYFSHHGIKT